MLVVDELGNPEGSDSYRTPLNPDVPPVDGFHGWDFETDEALDEDLASYECLDASGTREDYEALRNASWLVCELTRSPFQA